MCLPVPHSRRIDPSPTMNTADRTLSDKGFKRVTPWVFGPAFSDGLRADIIKL
jgi:hypothetical protein